MDVLLECEDGKIGKRKERFGNQQEIQSSCLLGTSGIWLVRDNRFMS